MKHRPPAAGADELIACPSCLALIGRSEAFCHACGAPVGMTATLDPINSIRSQGFLISRALEGRPKPITLIGLWLLNFPALVGGVFGAIYLSLHLDAFSGFIFFWFMIGIAVISFAILYRVTKNYVTIPEKKGGDEG